MLISTKGRYAMRLMIDMATHDPDKFSSLKLSAQRTNVSLKYLEAIVSKLCACGLLLSQRGKQGGYKLAKSPEDISLYDILTASQDELTAVECERGKGNNCSKSCLTKPLWMELDALLINFFKSISLKRLIEQDSINHTISLKEGINQCNI